MREDDHSQGETQDTFDCSTKTSNLEGSDDGASSEPEIVSVTRNTASSKNVDEMDDEDESDDDDDDESADDDNLDDLAAEVKSLKKHLHIMEDKLMNSNAKLFQTM